MSSGFQEALAPRPSPLNTGESAVGGGHAGVVAARCVGGAVIYFGECGPVFGFEVLHKASVAHIVCEEAQLVVLRALHASHEVGARFGSA